MGSPRDPRIDPRRGDKLATAFRTRTVTDTRRNHRGEILVDFVPGKGLPSWCRIESWRQWARNAEVLETTP